MLLLGLKAKGDTATIDYSALPDLIPSGLQNIGASNKRWHSLRANMIYAGIQTYALYFITGGGYFGRTATVKYH